MRQTTLCVPLEVKPESCSRLTALLEELRVGEETGPRAVPQKYAALAREVPTLHFMSMSVFTSAAYDPIFVMEANFDGSPSVFWGQMEAAFGERLRSVLRCCKRPLDEDGPLYDSVTSQEPVPIAPYFEARTQKPSAFHQGNRGLTRDRILREARLFDAVRAELDGPVGAGPSPYRGIEPVAVHARLKQQMVTEHPWLNEPWEKRLTFGERIRDFVRLLAFAVLLLLVLSAPGIVLSVMLPPWHYLAAILIVAMAAVAIVFSKRKPLGDTGVADDFSLLGFLARSWLLIAGILLAYVVVATVVLAPVVWGLGYVLEFVRLVGHAPDLQTVFAAIARAVLLGFLSLAATVPFLVLWLRYIERRDSSHDAPEANEHLLREMIRREDWIVQNHMGSLVLVKPGVLRTLLVRVGHLGLGLLVRAKATNGYLGNMRTIHFAHWAFLNNGSRLLFFSNFDHSWDSYLDDFIEKAHTGLTMAWTCSVGFPATRFLIYDGATQGRQFKNWGLATRTVSRFWYSAYPQLAVNQIERNTRIASGLAAQALTDKEAREWMRDL
ncbi:MAG TPA: hypothetical protein VMO26_02350 [Vicinamibacterales bacterium]|nr:hypothetical protein [Vicinamibacterales bacterium]